MLRCTTSQYINDAPPTEMRGVPVTLLVLYLLLSDTHAFHPEHVDDLQCVPCNTSTYCSGGSAFACPAHSVSSGVDASDVGDCVCERGYNRTGDVCVLGAPPYYYIDGIAQVCPAHMQTVDAGATHATWCVCMGGYEPDSSGTGCRRCVAGSVKAGLGNATCAACGADTFAEADGMEVCVSCAANASSDAGAAACFCDAGFVDSTGGDADGSACQACPANHYRTLDDAACVPCGTHFVSEPASGAQTDCLCDAGYYFEGFYSACGECPENTYKDFVSVIQSDESECASCPANTSSPLASTNVLECTCLAGFEAASDGVACAPCQPGTNKSSVGAGFCVDCPAHTFADALATLQCTDCITESTSPPGSESIDDCVCNPGNARIQMPEGPQCLGCSPGQYAGVDACLNCTDGTFSTEYGATECQSCPVNASSVESPHVECQCKKGYKCSGVECAEPAVLNFYGINVPTEEQIDKHGVTDTWFNGGHIMSALTLSSSVYLDNWVNVVHGGYPTTVCNNPIDNLPCYISTTENNGWVCDLEGSTYTVYQNGEPITLTMDQWWMTGCSGDGIDYFFEVYVYNGCRVWERKIARVMRSKTRVVFVKADNIHSYLLWDFDHNYLNNDPSIPEDAKNDFFHFTYLQGDDGDANCASDCCFVDTINNYQYQTVGVKSGPNCDSTSLEPCPDGNCEACPVNKYSDVTTSTLHECFGCQANSESPEASESQDACRCVPGYYEKTAHECEACAGGFFSDEYNVAICDECTGGQFSTGNATVCSDCPANSSSYDQPHTECQCDIGYHCAGTGPCPSGDCVACPTATFSDVTGDDITCQACQEGATSNEASISQNDCQCMAGYFTSGPLQCAACAGGEYSEALGSTICQPCSGEYVYTPIENFPFDSSTDCVDCELCADDFYDGAGNFTLTGCQGVIPSDCQTCAANSGTLYSATTADPNIGIESCSCDRDYYGPLGGPCTQCHSTQVRPEGRLDAETLIGDCQCVEGHEPNTTAECSACAIGSYKDAIGNTACVTCPATFTTEFTGIENASLCVCAPGYFYSVNEDVNLPASCEICPENTYKSGYNNNPECVSCSRENAISLPGSATDTDCLCKAAYFDAQIGFELTQYYHMIAYDYYLSVGKVDTRTMEMVSNGILSTSYITLIPWFRFPKVGPAFYEEVVNDGTVGRSRRFDNVFIERPIIATNMADCDEHLSLWKQMPCRIRKFTYQNSYFCDGQYCDRKIEYTDYVVFETWVMTQTYGPGYNQYTNNEFEKRMMVGGYGLDSNLKVWTVYFLIYNDILSSYNNVLELQQDFIKVPDDDLWIGGSYDLPLVYEKFSIINGLYQGNPTYTGCSICPVGYYKNITSNDFCTPCPAEHYNDVEGALECIPCPVNMVTNGSHGRGYCYCNVGQIPVVTASTQDLHTCVDCEVGKFKDVIWNSQCSNCSRCPNADERIQELCTSTIDDVCGPCQDYSNLPAGEAMRTFCNCNAGYEANEINDVCVACEMGKYRNTNANNSIPCQTCESGKFTSTNTTIECETCSSHCGTGLYVTVECVPVSDIECTACTGCDPGYYSHSNDNSTTDTRCGISNNNGRSDTTCRECDAGFYCQNSVRYSCGDYAMSDTGSDDASDCKCIPGFYNDSSACVQCEFDHHCTDGVLEPCPQHSFNNNHGSATVYDCQCLRKYYRNETSDSTSFSCVLCGPNDFCFNNTAFDCPDDRMVADAGSFVVSNCTCVSGFYNSEDDAACLECPLDAYCEHGLLFNCSLDRHTLEPRSTAAEDCLCRPGSRAVDGVCATCEPDTFCPGDETIEACPDHAVSDAGSVTLLDCECSEGYASVSPNASALECVACAEGKFKAVVANAACGACTVCSTANDAVYQHEACRARADAVCVPCSTCSGGGQYVSSVCEDLLDATCANCSVCDYSTEYTHTPCRATAPTQDTVCADITFDLSCPPGFYRGQHTQNSNSFCASCTYRDTPYLEYTLHEATGHGQTYNDPESCPIRCLGHSRLANVSLPVYGCVTCEDGNVLLKQFAEDPSDAECLFSCAPGYERVTVGGTDDCVLGALPASERSAFLHTVRVTDYGRYDGGSVLTVTHSNHSRFVIVVGGAAPGTCKQVRACCYDAQWRVSELSQAGFPSTVASDGCSREPELNHFAVRADTLRFQVPDARLEEVAGGCVWTGNATECVLTVSIIDTLLWYVASERVRIVTTRAAQHAVLGAQEYLPLSEFAVDVFLAYTTASGEHVYAVRTRMATQLPTLTVRERVVGMTHEAAFDEVLQECVRLQMQGVTMSASDTVQLSAGVTHVGLSFWRGATRMVHAYFTLQMGTDNDMTVAAVRNMHNMSALCTAVVHEQTFAVLHTTAVSGLGRARIEEMSWVANASYPLRGELGTLATFLVQARSTTPARFFVRDVIAVYLRTTGAHAAIAPLVPNATVLAYGHIDFTYAFRQACRAQGADCAYEYLRTHDYLHPSNPHAAVHVLANCSAVAQQAARGWLATSFGVPHDGEHVRAVCERALEQPDHAFAVFFVNTLAFVHREVWGRWHDTGMDAVRTYVWGNFGAETI